MATELALTNQELRTAIEEWAVTNQQLTHTNVDLDNFIYTVSHDLKAPILNIEGLVKALREELPMKSLQVTPVPRITNLIADSVKRLKRTIYHLIEITKLQKENLVEVTEVNQTSVMAEIQLNLAPVIKRTQAQIEVDVYACPTIHFSAKNLRSIIYNLLSNAIKYHSPERVSLVQVRYHTTVAYQALSVQDNGLGIALAQGHKLYAMFQRLHNHVEGSGIGLYMVKQIIENDGGKIEVQSKLDEGSVFQVYFKKVL